MKELDELINQILEFRNDRDWEQFHNSKNLALALSIEAAELNEIFLWKNDNEENIDIDKLKEELADVLIYSLLILNKHNLDFNKIIKEKLARNARKYPVEKSKGSSKKYDEL